MAGVLGSARYLGTALLHYCIVLVVGGPKPLSWAWSQGCGTNKLLLLFPSTWSFSGRGRSAATLTATGSHDQAFPANPGAPAELGKPLGRFEQGHLTHSNDEHLT